MKTYDNEAEQSPNPAKLADDMILALSSLERGATVSPEFLSEGVRLCDYLLHVINESKAQVQKERWTSHAIRDDSKALTESGINRDTAYQKTEEVQKWIRDLMANPSSHGREEIESIKEHLMNITMPMWRNRTSEFRERKIKRSLVIHG